MRRVTVLLAAAAAVVAFSLATPALACDGHKAESAAVVAKAEEAKPATADAKGGCGAHAMAADVAKAEGVKVEGVKAELAKAEGANGAVKAEGGCAKSKGCAKKATAATLAKNDEAKAAETK